MNSTERFGSRANAYALHRPSYPPAAIDAVLERLPTPVRVADIGAGTGISSRLLADAGASVVAIEPNASMREKALPHPNVVWRDGSAQASGLADESVDLVAMFQAFHWFANIEAMNEFARISRHRVALVQYERDETDAFSAAYGDIVRTYAIDDTEQLRMAGLELFRGFPNATVTEHHFGTTQRLDCDGLLGRAASASYLPQTGPSAEAMRAGLDALFRRFERDGHVRIAMQIYVVNADL